jgi:hypothetical protein
MLASALASLDKNKSFQFIQTIKGLQSFIAII